MIRLAENDFLFGTEELEQSEDMLFITFGEIYILQIFIF